MSSSFAKESNVPQSSTSTSSSSSSSSSRPGSRQRRARINAAENEEKNINMNIWSKEEEAEAIALIKEILSKGISPNQLIMQGFRADLVVFCSNQYNSGSSGEPSTSSVQIPTQPKAKRKRKKVGSKGKESSDAKPGSTNPANDTFTATSGSYTNLSEMPSDGVDDKESDIQYADLLRQKVELERERTKLLRFERERLANGPEENGQSASSMQTSADSEKMQHTDDSQNTSLAMDPVQAMRQAALASMKRKRHSNGQQNEEEPSSKVNRTLGEVTGDSQPMMHSSSLPHSPFAYQGSAGSVISFEIGSGDYQSNTPPLNAPRGPRNALPRYHDFDAPSNMEAIQREIEAAEALQSSEDADLWATDDSQQFVDPRAASQRSKPLAYYDDVSVPAGQVDYSAPLPSLSSAPIKGATSQDRPSIPAGRNQGIVQPKNLSVAYPFAPFQSRRRSPFLQNGTDQRVVLDLSDDEGEQLDCDDVNEEHIAARQYRNDNARLMHSIFKAVINGDSFGSQSRSRNISPTVSSTRSLLLSKEKEIELLKEKMRQLEQKKKADIEQTEAKEILTEVSGKDIGENFHLLIAFCWLKKRNLSDKQKDFSSISTTASPSFPAYESPFSRYPGLRAMLKEEKSSDQRGE